MAHFPTLKTGAVFQYPTTVKVAFGATRSVEFLDGSSHRYCTGPSALRQWLVRMEHLDGAETALVSAFVKANVSRTFSFTDPFSGDIVSRCALAGSQFQSSFIAESD